MSSFSRQSKSSLWIKILSGFQKFFALLGFMITLSAIILFVSFYKMIDDFGRITPLPENFILTYKLDSQLTEYQTTPRFDQGFFAENFYLHHLIKTIGKAKDDPRVKGLAITIEDPALNLAQYQELREAIIDFRASKKPAYIYAENYGAMGGFGGSYYLASAFDKIYMQPTGMVGLTGIAVEVPFFKGLLDKIGIKADMLHVGQYKSAPESLMDEKMSAPAKENLTSLITDLYRQVLADIVKDRQFKDMQSLLALINQGPYVDEEAVAYKLIDQLGYHDDMIAALKTSLKQEHKTITLERYFDDLSAYRIAEIKSQLEETQSFPAHLALIYATGTIISGSEDDSDARIQSYVSLGGDALYADDIAKAIHKAAENDKVKAIVIRLDSPGGSPSASEAIRHAILKAKKKNKPVVISMGGTVASGGYWLASAADHIVAMPTSITGSIGIFGGKIVMGDLAQKLGITFDGITIGQNAGMWSARKPFNDFERARFQKNLDHTYAQFITRVAEGRKLDKARVMALAEGRIYTGKQAQKLKLVDDLGNLDDAIQTAKRLAKLDPKVEMPIKLYPEPKDPFDLLFRMVDRNLNASQALISSPLISTLGEMTGLATLRESFLPLENHLLRLPVKIQF